jgi:Ca2+-binding EF-hand superfamily protein
MCFSSIDARELRKAMRTLGFKIPKASLEAMIGKQLEKLYCPTHWLSLKTITNLVAHSNIWDIIQSSK